MKVSWPFSKFLFCEFFCLSFSFLILVSSCSTDNGGEDTGDSNSDVIVQFSDKSVFNNELSGRIIAPDYQFTLFSKTSEAGNYIKSIFYNSADTKLVIFRGEGENTNRSLIFPIDNSEVSPFGYEFVTNEGAVTQLNIIERNPSQNTYAVLFNLYVASTPASGTQSNTQASKTGSGSFQKSSAIQEKTLEEDYIETTEVLASPGINLFNTSLPEILRKLEELPSSIADKLGEWRDEIVGLPEKIKKTLSDMNEVKTELERAEKESLEETLNEVESLVEEETALIEVQNVYPEGGMIIDGFFYELTRAVNSVYSGSSTYLHHIQIETHRTTYCEEEGESEPRHYIEFEWESSLPFLEEGTHYVDEFDAFDVVVYTGNEEFYCGMGEMEVIFGTIELIVKENYEVFNFNLLTDVNLPVVGNYKGELIRETED